MKKQKTKQIISLDDFDNTVSLWQLLPSGVGSGLKRLKIIVDSIQNGKVEQLIKPLSLLIVGNQGTRTHARAFLRALGLEFPYETPAHLLQSTVTEIYNYFNPTRLCDSYIISSVSLLYTPTFKTLHEIISSGRYSVFNNVRKATELIPVHNPIIMTTKNKKKIPEYFLEKIDHVVEIGDYTDQQCPASRVFSLSVNYNSLSSMIHHGV